MSRTAISGFDAAWTRSNCGAIAHLEIENDDFRFIAPETASFDQALASIQTVGADADLHIIGIDQPLIVRNFTGYRPVEHSFKRLLGLMKGAIMPANTSRIGMFDDGAPIWPFLRDLDADLDFMPVPGATAGTFAIEIYPAAALIGLFPIFLKRKRAAKYVPGKKIFSLDDWQLVCNLLAVEYESIGVSEGAIWCRKTALMDRPRKADQDKVDAVICVLITWFWWQHGLDRCLVAGDLETGYIVTPTNPEMTAIVAATAKLKGVPLLFSNESASDQWPADLIEAQRTIVSELDPTSPPNATTSI